MSENKNLACLSPHTLQNANSSYKDGTFDESNRILSDDYPSHESYQPCGRGSDETVVHYGRLQLFLNETEFLTIALKSYKEEFGEETFKNKKFVAIYAGAAPGHHLLILAEFFPNVKFILFDREPISFKYGSIRYEKNFIKRYQKNMYVQDATRLKNEYNDKDGYVRLFISDIRRNNKEEKIVQEDMDLQGELCKELNSYKSYLKFRLPYVASFESAKLKKPYLDGRIYFIAYGPNHTSETRLLVDQNAPQKSYECAKYENQMYYFNKYDRTSCYRHNINDVGGIDHCYDCRTFVYVVQKYLEYLEPTRPVTGEMLTEYTKKITEMLESNACKITYKYNLNYRFYDQKYRFTDLKYGLDLTDMSVFNRVFRIPTRESNDKSDFISDKLKNLHI